MLNMRDLQISKLLRALYAFPLRMQAGARWSVCHRRLRQEPQPVMQGQRTEAALLFDVRIEQFLRAHPFGSPISYQVVLSRDP
jgi:hypothetical protein